MSKTLDKISLQEKVIIKNIHPDCSIKRRLLDIGLIPGTQVTLLYKSPFNDPHAYLIRGTIISIRNQDAQEIEVEEVYE